MSKSKCVHHWILNSEGEGKCKKCQKLNKFPNGSNLEELIPISQISKGYTEVEYYKKKKEILPIQF